MSATLDLHIDGCHTLDECDLIQEEVVHSIPDHELPAFDTKLFPTYTEAEAFLEKFFFENGHRVRKDSRTSVTSFNKKVGKGSQLPLSIEVYSFKYVCKHYGSARNRGKPLVRLHKKIFPSGCCFQVTMKYVKTRKAYQVSSHHLQHSNHPIGGDQAYKIPLKAVVTTSCNSSEMPVLSLSNDADEEPTSVSASPLIKKRNVKLTSTKDEAKPAAGFKQLPAIKPKVGSASQNTYAKSINVREPRKRPHSVSESDVVELVVEKVTDAFTKQQQEFQLRFLQTQTELHEASMKAHERRHAETLQRYDRLLEILAKAVPRQVR